MFVEHCSAITLLFWNPTASHQITKSSPIGPQDPPSSCDELPIHITCYSVCFVRQVQLGKEKRTHHLCIACCLPPLLTDWRERSWQGIGGETPSQTRASRIIAAHHTAGESFGVAWWGEWVRGEIHEGALFSRRLSAAIVRHARS